MLKCNLVLDPIIFGLTLKEAVQGSFSVFNNFLGLAFDFRNGTESFTRESKKVIFDLMFKCKFFVV